MNTEKLIQAIDSFSQGLDFLRAAFVPAPAPKPPEPPRRAGALASKRILLDPGHSKSDSGAVGLKPGITEYAMNIMQANIIADAFRAEGADVEIYDPNPDSLTGVGQRANGKDLFISLHHNAANRDGNDEGTEVYVPTSANSGCRAVAKAVCDAICAAIGSRNRGVKDKNFTVIYQAIQSGCPICMLVESYFIDDYSDAETAKKRSTLAAQAIAKTVISRLG